MRKATDAQKRQKKETCRRRKKRRSESSSDSVPSDSSEFDALWEEEKAIKPLEKLLVKEKKEYEKDHGKGSYSRREKGRREEKEWTTSSSSSGDADGDDQGKKMLYKRSDSSLLSPALDSESDNDSSPNVAPVKSWTEMFEELKSSGEKKYARLMETFERFYYRMAFINSYNFDFTILGMLIRLEFHDPFGGLLSSVATGLQSILGPLQGDASGRLAVGKEECQEPSLTPREFLSCIYRSKDPPLVKLPPNYVMGKGETVKSSITLPNYQALPQLLDQGMYRDGVCVEVKPSLVTVGLSVPGKKNDEPFFMDLMFQIPKMSMPSTPFSDPCHTEIACIPRLFTDLFKGFEPPQVLKVKTIRPGSRKKTNGDLPDRDDNPEAATERLWSKKTYHSSLYLMIQFRFRFTHLGKMFSKHRCGPEKPGWALIFHAGGHHPPSFVKRTDYGYVGLGESVALVCDPIKNHLSVFQNGAAQPIMTKTAAALPNDIFNDWVLATVHYQPHQKKLVVVIASETDPTVKFVSKFPIDVRKILDHTSEMLVGFSTATAYYAVSTIESVSFQSPLPDLANSRIFFTDNYSIQPHERGHFLLQLVTSCDLLMPLSPVGLHVELRRITSTSSRRSAASVSVDSIVAHPDDPPVKCKVVARPKQSLYEIFYKPALPGRYRVFVALGKRPKEVGGDDHYVRKWYKVKNQHVYVRGLW